VQVAATRQRDGHYGGEHREHQEGHDVSSLARGTPTAKSGRRRPDERTGAG
jgi:hypothetical protein